MLKHKRAVVIVTLAGAIISAAVSLVIPPRYEVSASFLPRGVERELSGERDFFSQLGSFGETYAAFIRVRRNFIIEYIIRSRRMSRLMIERFDLEEVYGEKGFDKSGEKLGERTSVELRDEGVIIVGVEDRSPHRAKAMAEAYLHYVDSLLIDMSRESADERVRFLNEELERRRRRIASLDSALSDFMAGHGVIEIEQQARAVLEVAAMLRGQLTVLDVERDLLAMTLKPESPELQRMNREVEKLHEELLKFRKGSSDDSGIFLPLDELPGLAAEYVRLFTERGLNEFAATFIQLKLEDAKISANRRVSVIRVIDPPVLPERRAWPKRKQIVIGSALVAFLWTIFFLLIRERWREGVFSLARTAEP